MMRSTPRCWPPVIRLPVNWEELHGKPCRNEARSIVPAWRLRAAGG